MSGAAVAAGGAVSLGVVVSTVIASPSRLPVLVPSLAGAVSAIVCMWGEEEGKGGREI